MLHLHLVFRLSLATLVVGLLLSPALAQQSSPEAVEQYRVAANLQKLEQYDLAAAEWEKLLTEHPDDPLAAAARHYAGVCHFQQGNYRDAIEQFQAFLKDHPEHELLEATLANLGLAQYNLALAANEAEATRLYEEAASTLAKQQDKFPDGALLAQSDFFRGEALYALGKLNEAEKVYRQWLESHDDEAQEINVRLALGATQTELGKTKQAIATLGELLEQDLPPAIAASAALRMGEALVADGQFGEAAKHFAEAAASEGFADADHALQQQATALFQAGQFAAAAAAYEALPQRFPDSPLAAGSLAAAGKSYYQAQDFAQASDRLARALETTPADMDLAHWTIRAQLAGGAAETALATAERVLAEHDDPQILLDKADVLYELPDRRGHSIAAYVAAAEAAEGELAAEARHLAAATALELGDYAKAIKQADLLLAGHAESSFALDARQTLAEAKLQLGAPEDAAAIYRELLEGADDQQRADWSLRLAWALSAARDEAGVVETLQPLIDRLAGELLQQTQFLLGQALLRTGQYAAAEPPLSALANSAAKNAWSFEAALLLAEAKEKQGDTAAAVTRLKELIESSPPERLAARAIYRRGEIQQRAGQREPAQADFDKVAQTWPDHPLAPYADYRWAMLATAAGDHQAAAERLGKLIASHPDHTLVGESRLARATNLARAGNHEEALRALDELASTPTSDPRIALARGISLAGLEQWDEAITALTSATTAEGDFAQRDRALYELAWAYRSAQQPEQARDAFAKLASAFPDSSLAADASFRVGEARYDAGDYAAAVEPFRTAASHSAADTTLKEKAQHLIGWSRFKQGEAASAAGEFAKQLEQFPDGPLAADALWMIGEAEFAAGNHAEALAAYEKAKEAQPTSSDLAPLGMLHAGQAAGVLEEWQSSAGWLSEAAKKYPEYTGRSEIDYELGWALTKLGRPAEAKPLFEKVADTESSPLGARAQFMVGELEFADKKYEDAVRSFFKVAYGYGGPEAPEEFHPWQAESLFEAARCLEQLDRTDAARKLYGELLERYPDEDKAQLAERRLQELRQ